ncbi:probable G-protein coupled receptor 149 [Coregonus clupeaformis]|uniref:probable G-protein coupled receptor 149 n=1 Tax=Coregonus clupeaformis TaxID=59861 RepID=UPI001BE02E67|nr:probable G-protein coupled receptor 149 [Coregonus clupeaformis]
MSSTLSSPSPNKSSLFTASYERTDLTEAQRHMSMLLFGLCVAIAAATFVGGVYSLLFFIRMRWKTILWLIVASMSVDDLLSVIPLSLFMLLQWERDGEGGSVTICTLSGLLYVFQGLSSNMKACLIAAYTFYVTKREGSPRPLRVMWAIAGVWVVSLTVSVLPLCGWGSFTPVSLGCFPERHSFYVLLLFTLYSLCFCGLVFFFVPLTYQLLCSREPQRTFYPSYLDIARDLRGDGSAPLCDLPSFSRDSLDRSFSAYKELNPGGLGKRLGVRGKVETYTCPTPASDGELRDGTISNWESPVFFAQKRFSMILAVLRVVLWMPMMTLVLVRHAVNTRSSSLETVETVSFFLTLLAPAVTPVFMLSECWIHLPCGCFINCRRDKAHEPTAKKKRFEFNLSFQQGYRIYKISHATKPHHSPSIEKRSYHNLFNFTENRLAVLDSSGVASLQAELEFMTPRAVDSSPLREHGELLLEAEPGGGEALALADCLQFPHGNHGDQDGFFCGPSSRDHEDLNLTDTSSVFEGTERRLSHEECRKMELTDWEWCRSKSERTPRQRSGGGLSIPLCAFQGTVSLHAPTGKTLSLSTYEVSSDGLTISPHVAKKVEVYRSKSEGHEPSADDPTTGGPAGGVGMEVEVEMGEVAMGDTNVKIHLEVLEICDNEEAMDSVSIISNISQSSTHTRSPSLRYSLKENRFVSCDLGETASYSLLIPNSGNPEADNININIPDTVEAHRQNSRRQTQETGGYREEIQLLNEGYRKQEEDREDLYTHTGSRKRTEKNDTHTGSRKRTEKTETHRKQEEDRED